MKQQAEGYQDKTLYSKSERFRKRMKMIDFEDCKSKMVQELFSIGHDRVLTAKWMKSFVEAFDVVKKAKRAETEIKEMFNLTGSKSYSESKLEYQQLIKGFIKQYGKKCFQFQKFFNSLENSIHHRQIYQSMLQ